MGKVEDSLKHLIQYQSKRVTAEVLGNIPVQVRQVRRDVRALMATVDGLVRQVRALAREREEKLAVPPASEGQIEKARLTKRTLKSIRKRLGLTQQALARLLTVSPLTVASWESGKARPRKRRLAQIIALRSMGRADVDKVLEREPELVAMKPGEIKMLRSRLGLTQVELARRLGVSPAAVTTWEAGRTTPTPHNRQALAAMRDLKPQEPEEARGPARLRARQRAPKAAISPDAIRALRKRLNMSQKQFADTVGVSLNTVSNWETGHTAPRYKSLAKLQSMK